MKKEEAKEDSNLNTSQLSELNDKVSIMHNSFEDFNYKLGLLEEQNIGLLQEIRKMEEEN